MKADAGRGLPRDRRIERGGITAFLVGGLERKIALSRWALALERAWPRLWLPLGVILLFLLVTVAGLWSELNSTVHRALLIAFGLGLAGSVIPALRTSWPTREDGLRRLERFSGVPHRPASSYEDVLDESTADHTSRRLWSAHRSRLEKLFGALRPKAPLPRFERFDPLALRSLLILLVALGTMLAGASLTDRLASPFRLTPDRSGPLARLDAWVAPPVYTRRPPVMLADGSRPATEPSADEAAAGISAALIEVPEKSILIVRASGAGHEKFTLRSKSGSGAEAIVAPNENSEGASGVTSYRIQLDNAVDITLLDGSSPRSSWRFQIIEDRPPEIALKAAPQQTPRGALSLNYTVKDDYGVVSAEGQIALATPPKSRPAMGADGKPLVPLGEAPVVRLKLPKKGAEEAKSIEDLSAHPWAGQRVILTLSAKDQAGKKGVSKPFEFALPERRFTQPLARALVEQRRNLAITPGDYNTVAFALDTLTLAPETFGLDETIYLGMRTAYWRLSRNVTQDTIVSVAEQLWQMALRIEDGNLSEAAKALRDAQERLAKAIEEGASNEEIERLMKELRQALANYLKSLVEQAERNPQPQDRQNAPQRQLSMRDLDDMLKNIEKLAKSGAKDQAQQLLSELRDMLDRMQAGKDAGGAPQNSELQRMLEQFGGLITKQRKLLEDTFKAGRGQRDRGQSGDGTGEQQDFGDQQGPGRGNERTGSLAGRQGELQSELERLMQSLKEFGQDANRQLQGAQREMNQAKGALQEDNLDQATESQGQALDQLRRGAQDLADRMQQGSNGRQATRMRGNNRDPLDRELGNDGSPEGFVEIPRDIEIQRAREILEELRRRLGETARPMLELDYLERLLKKN